MASAPLTASEIEAAARGWVRRVLGDACPVDGKTLVQVRCLFEQDFDEAQMPRRARSWDWLEKVEATAITHFRVAF